MPQLVEGEEAEYNIEYDWLFLAAGANPAHGPKHQFYFYTAFFTGVKVKPKFSLI